MIKQMENIENTMMELLKVNPLLTIELCRLIISVSLLVALPKEITLDQTGRQYQYMELRNTMKKLEDMCLSHVLQKENQ